jgi:hypothetical protein
LPIASDDDAAFFLLVFVGAVVERRKARVRKNAVTVKSAQTKLVVWMRTQPTVMKEEFSRTGKQNEIDTPRQNVKRRQTTRKTRRKNSCLFWAWICQ